MILLKPNIILDIFLPKKCFACEDPISSSMLCDVCLSMCERNHNPLFFEEQSIASLFSYTLTIKSLIKSAKFNNSLQHANVLLYIAHKELQKTNLLEKITMFNPCCISYVPSSFQDRIKRGFELPLIFAKLMGKLTQKPVVDLLKKPLLSKKISNIKIKAERIEAVKNTFLIKNKTNFERILLIDDVVTTKATLNECQRVLRPWCKKIIYVTIAQTPF